MVIMPGVVIKEKHLDNDITPGTLFAVSKSGYTNDLLSLKQLEHFDLKTYKKKKERWRMLVIDGHGSHLTREFIDYCYDHDISPFLLPPHSTHLLQPLDIGVF